MRRYFTFISVLVFLFINILNPCRAQDPVKVREILDQVEKQEYNTETVDTLLEYSYLYWARDLDSSLMFGELAYQAAKKIGYIDGIADAHYKRSVAFRRKGELINAVTEAKKCLVIADSIRDSTLLAKLNYQLGTIYKSMSNKKEALKHYNKALSTYLFMKDSKRLIAVYNGLGTYFQNVGAYQSALMNYQNALFYAMELNDEKNQGIILGNLGSVYRELGLYEIAEEYFTTAYAISNKYENIPEQSNILNRMGSMAYDQQEYDKADSLYKLSYELKLQKNDFKGINNILINTGLLYLKRGMLEEAMQNFNTALAYYRENDISEGIIAAWQGKVEYYLAINDYSTAYIYNDSSLQLAKETIDLNRIEQIYQSLSIISEAQGNISDALHYFRLFDAMGDSINSIEKTQMLYQLDLMGEKEKQDLAKFIRQEERNIQLRQRNTFAYVIIGLVVLAIYLVIFFRFRAKKNQVIAEQRVKQLEEEKKLLAVRFLVEGQEEERKRIATELHDGLGALLSVTKMQFTAIKDVRPENKPQYDKIAQFLEQASGDVRKISHNMMPGLLTKLGLCEALEDLFETLNDSEGMDARLEIVGPKERLPENKEIMIYRIIQEIVNNSLKHANANKIDLTIIVHPDQLDISCSDNGIGFDRDRILGKKTIGIQSIHSRVKFLDGNICIDSSPGNGTVYRINIPLEPKH